MSYSADGAHGRTFMRTNDANDDPPNSRRPSLQTITPVALIFSWLLFDETTRKCIIRRWCSPTAIVVEVLPARKSTLLSLLLTLTFYLVPPPSCHPLPSPATLFSIWHAPALSLHFRTYSRRRRERDTYSNSRINYEQRRAFVRKAWSRLQRQGDGNGVLTAT